MPSKKPNHRRFYYHLTALLASFGIERRHARIWCDKHPNGTRRIKVELMRNVVETYRPEIMRKIETWLPDATIIQFKDAEIWIYERERGRDKAPMIPKQARKLRLPVKVEQKLTFRRLVIFLDVNVNIELESVRDQLYDALDEDIRDGAYRNLKVF